MQLSDALRLRIKLLLKENDMKVWDLCKVTGIPCSTLSTFLTGKSKLLKLNTILHICEGLNIQLKDFFADENFFDVEDD
jgi:DNA-binding Xre family transcriptional regulator